MFRVNSLIARSFHLVPSLRQAWPIPLRLIVGYGFMEHGYAKLARGPEFVDEHFARPQRARAVVDGVGDNGRIKRAYPSATVALEYREQASL
jgi:hypothetical protein